MGMDPKKVPNKGDITIQMVRQAFEKFPLPITLYTTAASQRSGKE